MTRLHYRVYGEQGDAVVLLHGLFGSLENWHSISLELARQFHVIAADQRNHGRSPHQPEMNYELMARDLLELLDSLHLEKAGLVGHSMGGKTAMQFALVHPERVSKLVVADIAPKAYPPWHAEILKALLSLNLSGFQRRQQIDQALADSIPENRIRQFLLKGITRDDDGGFRWRLNLKAIASNYVHLNAALAPKHPSNVPALFLSGGESDYVQPPDHEVIKRLFPRASFHAITGAGHWVHADNPPAFLSALLEFLHSTTDVPTSEYEEKPL
jgi:esterase